MVIRSILAGAIALSGLFILVATFLKVAIWLGDGDPIPWARTVAVFTTGIILTGLGIVLSEKRTPTYGLMRLFEGWLAWGMTLIGTALMLRFFFVLGDSILGISQPLWAVEGTIAVLALGVGLPGWLLIKKQR